MDPSMKKALTLYPVAVVSSILAFPQSQAEATDTDRGQGQTPSRSGAEKKEDPGTCAPLPSQHWDGNLVPPCLAAHVGSGEQTLVLMLSWQTLS